MAFVAAESAERERIQKLKDEKRKLAEDRHKQNVDALVNLQKALVCVNLDCVNSS